MPSVPLLVPVALCLWYIEMGCFMSKHFAVRAFASLFVLLHLTVSSLSLVAGGRSALCELLLLLVLGVSAAM